MKYFLIIGLVLAMTISGWTAGEGQDDFATLGDYFNSFTAKIISYTPNLWRLDADSSNIRQAFNDVMVDVSKLAGATQRVDTIVMDSTFWYNLPSDYQSVVAVAINDPTGGGEYGLDSIIFSDRGKNTLVGEEHPKYYTIFARQIYFDRNNYLEDSVWVYYNAYSKVLSANADTSNISMFYFNVVVDEAIINFYSGRVGSAVPQILALADKRLVQIYKSLNVEYRSITPDVR